LSQLTVRHKPAKYQTSRGKKSTEQRRVEKSTEKENVTKLVIKQESTLAWLFGDGMNWGI